ncbi:MAG: MBOAT family protein [Clostridiales Family XIII bacterium]|jgi:alginate O-acetyltransferase complex protein AlgI|nr:MBOAT family protein [Clostridiales Family XIII bacterium]
MLCYFVRRSLAWRNGALILFSLIFYAWGEPVIVFLMLATVAVNYGAALLMGGRGAEIQTGEDRQNGTDARDCAAVSADHDGGPADERRRRSLRRASLLAAIVFDIGMLIVFKYSGFLVETFNILTRLDLPVPQIALPIGISFYTFQILSYVVDVYRGEVETQRSFPKLLLYVALFPQLVAGPIVRYGHVAAEIGERETDFREVCAGIERFTVGLAKKAVLANVCGSLSVTYMEPAQFGSLSVMGAWFGLLMYTLQIYFDFSAYSDMAIGMGRILGFHYHENFRYPYLSRSVTEFWRRWHISLSSFFRDYVYIPLGGSRRRRVRNLLIVWTLTGLWHGASWNFVLWGLWYFAFIVAEKSFLRKRLESVPRILRHVYLLLVVMIGWVWFYFTDMGLMFAFLGKLFGVGANGLIDPGLRVVFMNNVFFVAFALLACMRIINIPKAICAYVAGKGVVGERVVFAAKCIVIGGLLFVATVMLVGNSYNPFIYFRF